MEWENLIGVITALIALVVLPLALKARKKAGPRKRDELLSHLQGLGVKASLLEKGAQEEKVGRSWGQKSEGVIRLEGGKIDCINITGVSSQYGTNYFLDFLVEKSSFMNGKERGKTRLFRKRSLTFWGKVVSVQWKGDEYLSRELNFDFRLRDILMYAQPGELRGGIQIYPEPKHEYARIRINYSLPSLELLEAMEAIAGHIRSVW